jgi:hypothetical protein
MEHLYIYNKLIRENLTQRHIEQQTESPTVRGTKEDTEFYNSPVFLRDLRVLCAFVRFIEIKVNSITEYWFPAIQQLI